MSEGFGPGQLYRVQTDDGRGPWRPGLSKHWIDTESDKPLYPDVVSAFGLEWRSKIPKGWHCGCACRSLYQLLSWFTRKEQATLAKLGYYVVCFKPDKIIAEDEYQVIFARKKPLTDDVQLIGWPELAGVAYGQRAKEISE